MFFFISRVSATFIEDFLFVLRLFYYLENFSCPSSYLCPLSQLPKTLHMYPIRTYKNSTEKKTAQGLCGKKIFQKVFSQKNKNKLSIVNMDTNEKKFTRKRSRYQAYTWETLLYLALARYNCSRQLYGKRMELYDLCPTYLFFLF